MYDTCQKQRPYEDGTGEEEEHYKNFMTYPFLTYFIIRHWILHIFNLDKRITVDTWSNSFVKYRLMFRVRIQFYLKPMNVFKQIIKNR